MPSHHTALVPATIIPKHFERIETVSFVSVCENYFNKHMNIYIGISNDILLRIHDDMSRISSLSMSTLSLLQNNDY